MPVQTPGTPRADGIPVQNQPRGAGCMPGGNNETRVAGDAVRARISVGGRTAPCPAWPRWT